MSAYIKPILALLISFLIFAGITFLADKELLDVIQTRYYNPSVVKSYLAENIKDAEFIQSHLLELQEKFAFSMNEPSVRSSFLYNQNTEDIYERSRIFGLLLETTGGLQSVKFVDNNGIRIHYSTSSRDIINQNPNSTSYRNYTEDPIALPYDTVSVPANTRAKFTVDDQYDRIIFSYPFHDSMDVYRGTALYFISVRAFADKLVAEGRLKISDDISVIGDPPGIVVGNPDVFGADVKKNISDIWSNNRLGRATLDAEASGMKYSLISTKTENDLYFGRLVNDSMFSVPDSMNMVIRLSMFLTFFLTLYFLINLKPNSVTVVRTRLRRLRENLFEQLYVNKTSQDRAKWILELEQRRDEIRSELKRNLKLMRRVEKNIDSIIDKSWDELLAVMKTGSQVLLVPAEAAAKAPNTVLAAEAEPEALEDLEEIEEVEALEEVEEIEEVEALEDLEEIEEVEALEDLEEIEEVEALEEVEELEDLEEIEEAEALEDIEEIEEVEALEEVEEIEEIAETTSAEEINDITENESVDLKEEYIEIIDDLASGESLSYGSSLEDEVRTQVVEEPVSFAKGLLGLADKINVSEKPEPSVAAAKGLLGLADKINVSEKPEPSVAAARKGLLGLASNFEQSADIEVLEEAEEIVELETIAELDELEEIAPAPVKKGKGLLAMVSENIEEEKTFDRKELIALERDIEFSRDYPVPVDEKDLDAELDIVSPFSSMFSSLK